MDKETGIRQFAGNNFPDWRYRLECLFEEYDLKDHIKKPQEESSQLDEMLTDWSKKEAKAKNLIVKHVAPSHIQYIKDKSSAWLMMENLIKTFEPTSLSKRVLLKRRLNMISMKEGEELQTYFLRFSALVEEFKSAGGTVDNDEIVVQLLATMPDEYDSVVTVLETLGDTADSSKKLTLDRAKAVLIERELKLQSKKSETASTSAESSAAFNAQKQKTSSNPNSKYPNKQQKNKSGLLCYNCGRAGHKQATCRFPPKDSTAAIATVASTNANTNSSKGHAFMVGEGSTQAQDGVEFVVDSGATDHMINNMHLLHVSHKLQTPLKVKVAKEGSTINVTHGGTLRLVSKVESGRKNLVFQDVTLNDVLVAPELRSNLLSVRKIAANGGEVIFKSDSVEIRNKEEIVARGARMGNLFIVKFSLSQMVANLVDSSKQAINLLWHRRLGHLHMANVCKLASKMSSGIKDDVTNQLNFCEACVRGKQTKLPYDGTRPSTKRPLERVHSDVCGPMSEAALDGSRYFVTFIDDYTHFLVIYLLKSKDEVFGKFEEFLNMAQTQFGTKLAHLRTDRGGEYVSNAMKQLCKNNGTILEMPPPYNSQLNGVAERMNRTIVDRAKTMLIESNLPLKFWGEAVLASNYLTNRSPTTAIKVNKTPYELWYKQKPDLSKIRVFGCDAFACVPKQKRSKFEPSGAKMVMVGYDVGGGYRLFDPESHKIVAARNVVFNEEHSITVTDSPQSELTQQTPNKTLQSRNSTQTWNSTLNNETLKQAESPQIEPEESNVSGSDEEAEEQKFCTPSGSILKTNFRRNKRRECRDKMNPKFLDYDCYVAFSAQSWIEEVPMNYRDVFGREDEKDWLAAMDDELNSLNENNTWQIINKPPNAKLLSTRWVFKIKDESPNCRKYKARLVAKGFLQKEGIDYAETYAPVARMPTIRLVLALAVQFGYVTRHLDVTTAFLYGELEETVYLKTPEGVTISEGKVIKLNKSLYGLKQSPKCWNIRFHKFISKLGFIRTTSDYCLYLWVGDNIIVYLVLYVDDMLITANNLIKLNEIVQKLSTEFKMKDLGSVSRFMGLNISIDNQQKSLKIDQTHYINKILLKFDMFDCKPVGTPMEVRLQLQRETREEASKFPFRELIGSLMFLCMGTRPDLNFSVNFFSRYQEWVEEIHYKHLKRTLRYLQGTKNLGLTYKFNDQVQPLTTFVDADFAADEYDRKSVSGYLIFVFGSAVMWASKKQVLVTRSSTEAEFVAADAAVCETLWFRKVLYELGIKLNQPTKIFEDNQGAIFMSKNPETKRTKHMDVKYNFIRECVEKGNIELQYISTQDQLADIMTKQIPKDQFQKLRDIILGGSVV